MSPPKHKYLLTYRYAEIIHDLTVEFCLKYLSDLGNLGHLRGIPTRRTIDQMVQAARSGKQNIIEGVNASRISKKTEIKLLGVAESSLEELIGDYEDFLRQRRLVIWPKTDSRIMRLKAIGYRLSHLRNLSHLGYLKEKPILPDNPEEAANFLLTLCHQASYLLYKQIEKAEQQFILTGGYTENLFKMRLKGRINSKSP